jgi:hypothetical protein
MKVDNRLSAAREADAPLPHGMTDDVRMAVWVQFMDGGESGASLQEEYGLTHWQVEEALRWAWKQVRP